MNRIETASAVVERVNDDLVICRYKPGVIVDASAVQANLDARKSFPGSAPYAVIGIFPEDIDFDMTLLNMDHYGDRAMDDETRVLAIVAEGRMFEQIAQLYFAYHPTHFPNQVFMHLADALVWVNEQLELRDSA